MTKRCLIMAGGTGGHVFPGLALANKLQDAGWKIDWLGTKERMEADTVPKYGFPIHFVPVKGIRGKGILAKLKGAVALLESIVTARSLIKQLKPDLVVGMGGYASGPGGIAAWTLRVPVLIHEQNAAPGMTNRLLARFAKRVCLGFEQAKSRFGMQQNKCLYVGNPVRDDICRVAQKSTFEPPINMLVVGGSLGSAPLNEIVPQASAYFPEVAIWHQCGKDNKQKVSEAYQERNVKITEFIDDMAQAYEWADCIVCRAGALTVAETSSAGIPAIFVPLPHAVDDHQTLNAKTLADKNAAVVIKQAQLLDALPGVLLRWQADPSSMRNMGILAKQNAPKAATQKLVSICQELTGEAA